MPDDENRPNALSEGSLESLMHRYQQADAEAAAALAEQLSSRLYRFFVAQVRNRDRAEDLLQDCWLRIHKARHSYRPGEPVLPWIYAIARRVQVDGYRKKRRIAQYELQKENVEEIPAVAAAGQAESGLKAISDLLKTLPPQQRETVLLLKVAGLSLEEVSRTTGASVGAVKQRAHRAYSSLRRLFGDQQ